MAEDIPDDHFDTDNDLWQLNAERIGLGEEVTFKDYVMADDNVQTCEALSDSRIVELVAEGE